MKESEKANLGKQLKGEAQPQTTCWIWLKQKRQRKANECIDEEDKRQKG